MKLKQYNLGKWVGVYYSELQNSLSIVGIVNSLVNLTVLWAVASKSIVYWFPWLNYPLFMIIVFAIVLAILPLADYILLYKTRQSFLNEQGWKHDNPVKWELDIMKKQMIKMCEKMNVEIEDGMIDKTEATDGSGKK
jgi:ABC-type amino acid transport system permease subunit